jgi:hypothetical protein
MSNWKAFLFFTLLVLAVLLQVVALGWGLEAVFFVTLFTLVLVVEHDTRLSPALGLVFLAICPFLLIADKEPAAEQAANYAYFFLAIGVLVQLEEMVLERYDRLGWKVDISFLWRPVAEEIRGSWITEGLVPNPTGTNPRGARSGRWILIIGIGGLAFVFLGAVFTGVPQSFLVPLLGGSILFIFLVWGLRLVLLALGKVWLSQFIWALVLLPMVVMGGIWASEIINAYRMAHMEVAYDLIGDEPRRVLYQHPAISGASRISFPTQIESDAVLAFELGISPEIWEQPGDGVLFTVYVNAEDNLRKLFSAYIDPKNNQFDRRWHPYTIDLGEYAGQEGPEIDGSLVVYIKNGFKF